MNPFEVWLMWLETLGDKIGSLIIIGINLGCIYGLYRLIKYLIRYHAQCQSDFVEQREQKQNNQKKMDDINQELDEIEASLDAVSSNDKVTPIWGGQPTKKP